MLITSRLFGLFKYYSDNKTTESLVHLRHGIEFHHGSSEGISIGAEGWNETQHGAVKGSINLSQRRWTWVVNVHHGNVTQEP